MVLRRAQSSGGSTTPSTEMEKLLGEYQGHKSIRPGEFVDGVVMRVDKDAILVNIGQKSEGVVPLREMRSLGNGGLSRLKVGDEVVVFVLGADEEDGEGQIILSLDKAREEKGWRTLQRCFEKGETLRSAVVGFNKGGVIVDVEGVQGFVPISQIGSLERGNSHPEGENRLAQMVGSQHDFKVLELNRSRNRVILSERAALQELRQRQKEKLLSELKEGEVRHGRITGISSFGAFVDLGGADGLIHISELSWGSVNSPEDVVKAGEERDVYVLKVDQEAKKIALSLKRLQPEPWVVFLSKYQPGQTLEGVVTRTTAFGAFVRVEGGVEGLIHISELADRPIRHPKEVVKEGQEVKVKILRIEPERRRLGLTLRQVEEIDYALLELNRSQEVPGKVSSSAGESYG